MEECEICHKDHLNPYIFHYEIGAEFAVSVCANCVLDCLNSPTYDRTRSLAENLVDII